MPVRPAKNIPPRHSRSGLAGMAVVLGVLALVLALIYVNSRATGAAPSARLAAADKPLVTAPRQDKGDAAARYASLSSVQVAASSGPPTVSGSPGPGQVEICGVGYMPAEGAKRFEPDAQLKASAAAARRQLIDTMSGQADERTRVAGLLLKRIAAIEAEPSAYDQAAVDRCGDDHACLQAASDASLSPYAAGIPAGEEIAKMASTTRDPMVYAAAMQACGKLGSVPQPPSCRMISARQWARLDPSNTVAWLQVADEASSKKDAAGVADALYHVTTAKNGQLYTGAVATLAEPYMAGVTGYQKMDLDMLAISAFSGWSLPAYLPVSNFCAASQLTDSNRRQTCDAIARKFTENSTTLIELRIGMRIAERLGWPAGQLAQVREHADATYQAAQNEIDLEQPWSCLAIERAHRHWMQMAKLGEVGAARAAIAASGKSEATWAAEMREATLRQQRARASEAASASSASAPGH